MSDWLWTGLQMKTPLPPAFAHLRRSFGLQRIHRQYDLETSIHAEHLYNRNNEASTNASLSGTWTPQHTWNARRLHAVVADTSRRKSPHPLPFDVAFAVPAHTSCCMTSGLFDRSRIEGVVVHEATTKLGCHTCVSALSREKRNPSIVSDPNPDDRVGLRKYHEAFDSRSATIWTNSMSLVVRLHIPHDDQLQDFTANTGPMLSSRDIWTGASRAGAHRDASNFYET